MNEFKNIIIVVSMNIIISEFCFIFDVWKIVGLNVFWLNCSDERNY